MVNKFIACILSALIVLPALAQETAGEVEETVEYSDSGREVVLRGPRPTGSSAPVSGVRFISVITTTGCRSSRG